MLERIYKNKQIVDKKRIIDRNEREFLVLTLGCFDLDEEETFSKSKKDTVLLFHSNIRIERWDDYEVGKYYDFTCKEGSDGKFNIVVNIEEVL